MNVFYLLLIFIVFIFKFKFYFEMSPINMLWLRLFLTYIFNSNYLIVILIFKWNFTILRKIWMNFRAYTNYFWYILFTNHFPKLLKCLWSWCFCCNQQSKRIFFILNIRFFIKNGFDKIRINESRILIIPFACSHCSLIKACKILKCEEIHFLLRVINKLW